MYSLLCLGACDEALDVPADLDVAVDAAVDAAVDVDIHEDIDIHEDADLHVDVDLHVDADLRVDADPHVDADATPDIAATDPAFPSALADALRSHAETRLPSLKAPGATITVAIPQLGVYRDAVGVAVRGGEGRPMRYSDRLRVGSVTKTFTAAVILQLVDEGVLVLDDPADDWVADLELGAGVTIRRLLNHTSGLYNYTDDAAFLASVAESATPREVIAFARAHGQVFEPGTSWLYSNTGYYVLGLVIEAATGSPYHEVVRERLLDPLGLADSFFEDFEPVVGGMADGHVGGREGTDLIHMSWAWAAGGLVSTGDDLCRWADALFAGDVVPATLLGEMLEPDVASVLAHDDYGLGIMRRTQSGTYLAGHTGSTMGFRGELFFDLETGACVALLTNDFLAEPRRLSGELWDEVRAWLSPGE